MRTSVRKHPRKTRKGKTVVKQHKRKVAKRPQKIGSKWTGDKYVHGPRKVSPKKCSKFRVGKPVNKEGQRLVFCELKSKRDAWVVQSKLTPRKNRGAMDKDIFDLRINEKKRIPGADERQEFVIERTSDRGFRFREEIDGIDRGGRATDDKDKILGDIELSKKTWKKFSK